MKNSKQKLDHEAFFSNLNIPYPKSKNDVWNELSEKIDKDIEKTTTLLKPKRHLFISSAAAMIIVLIGIAAFMRFYSVNIHSPGGQHLATVLPDGSTVHLNAETGISYKPYWWKFSRELELDGEAFFDVKKGKNFKVVSDNGITEVLGTSFNIFSRNNNYKVHCITGKVLVSSNFGEQKVLRPSYSVEIKGHSLKKIQKEEKIENVVAWIDNKFFFTGVPIKDVFEEIERQFDINIELKTSEKDKYTGNFERGSSPDEILDLICKPFGLMYQKKSNTYIIEKQ